MDIVMVYSKNSAVQCTYNINDNTWLFQLTRVLLQLTESRIHTDHINKIQIIDDLYFIDVSVWIRGLDWIALIM